VARTRSVKPGFFKNEVLAALPPYDQLLFIGLWMLADREGRLEDRPKRIKAEIFPYEALDVEASLSRLAEAGFVLRYGPGFIQIVNFHKHQAPHYKEIPSVIPPAPEQENRYRNAPISERKRQQIFDRDGRACVKCRSTDDLSIDHIHPRTMGGSSADDNLQTLCKKCNSSKNNRLNDNSIIDLASTDDRPILNNPAAPSTLPPVLPSTLIMVPDDESLDVWFEEVYGRHPKKKDRILAQQALGNRLKDPKFKRADFDRSHKAWCATAGWRDKNGQFAPSLAAWIDDQGYKFMPEGQPTRAAPKKTTVEPTTPTDPEEIAFRNWRKESHGY
jgi:hypothetical protein